ncbi:MAG: aldolase/citrate lyase family protein [Candidatus Poribacteria bacterium]|nr:aldolase/citrate lyase family protein [Candidatus Poribacteria bacterium]MDE0506681.1 aldolase/citrate lyase family protein [Candidatus Poribacteria bacterium]
MEDRLKQLLSRHNRLYGVICRDATPVDIELLAQLGYHLVWIDLEHSTKPLSEVNRLGRSIAHLGMVPLVRIPELSRAYVQLLLDGGIPNIILPDVRSADEARQFVELAKYPPIGRRGVSSTTAAAGYTLGAEPQETLSEANDGTHLMVLIESDEGYAALDDILEIDEVDMIMVGQQDWGASSGIFGELAKEQLSPKIDRLTTAASEAGKIVAASASSPEDARRSESMGARIFILGVDITIKRGALAERIRQFHE